MLVLLSSVSGCNPSSSACAQPSILCERIQHLQRTCTAWPVLDGNCSERAAQACNPKRAPASLRAAMERGCCTTQVLMLEIDEMHTPLPSFLIQRQ